MAVSNEQITSYLAANPGLTDAAIAAAMNEFKVTPAQMAAATGLNVADVQSRYDAVQPAAGALQQATVDPIEQLYTQYAGRGSDPGGLDYWRNQFGADVDANEAAIFQRAVAENVAKGVESTATGANYNPYFAANPDVAAEYMRNTQGMTPDQFAQTHYQMFGVNEGRVAPAGALSQATQAAAAEAPLTLTYHTGQVYQGDELLSLARELAGATSDGALQGGVYGEVGGNIGFAAEEARKLFGDNTTAVGQVFLDAAAQLLNKGVTSLSQLKYGDITGQANVVPVIGEDGQITGYRAYYGNDNEGNYTFSRDLTPEEAAQVKTREVSDGEGTYTTYEPITTVVGKGIVGPDGKTVSDSSQLHIGSTYTGPGGTFYTLTIDPATGKPAFSTFGQSSSSLGLIAPLLTIAQFVPGLAPFAAAANAAIALDQGNKIGALTSLLGIPGVGNMLPAGLASTLQTVNRVSNLKDAADRGDVLGLINAGVNLTNTGGAQIGDTGYTVGQALNAVDFANAVRSGDVNAITRAVSSVISANRPTTGEGGITNRVYDDTIVQAGADAFIRAKEAGMTDEEAYAAANVVTGVQVNPIDAGGPNLSSSTTYTGAANTVDTNWGDLDTAVDTQARNTQIERLATEFERTTGRTLDKVSENEIAAMGITMRGMPLDQLQKLSVQDLINRTPTIVGKDDQGRWLDSEGYSYDDKGLRYAPGSNVPGVEIVGGTPVDASGNAINLTTRMDTAGNDLANWANSLEGTSGDVVRQTLSTILGAGGEQIADIGTAFSNMGFADRYNVLVQLGQSLERTGQNLEIPGVTEATRNFWNNVQDAETYSGKVAAALKSVVDNPLVLTQVAKEGLQEVAPLVTGGAVFKLIGKGAGIATDVLLNAAESMGSSSRQKFNEEIAKGTPVDQAERLANADGWKAFAITTGTAGLADASLIKGYEKAMEKIVGRVTSSTSREFVQEGAEELAIALATGDDLPTALSKSVAGSLFGAKTSGSMTAATSIQSDIEQAFAAEGLTSTDGTFRPGTIVASSDTGAGNVIADSNTTATVQNVNNVITDSATLNGDTAQAVNVAVTDGVSSGADTKSVVDASIGSALNNGVDSTVAVGNTVSAAIDAGADLNITVSNAVNTATNNGVNASTAVAAAVNSATTTGANSNAATNAATTTDTGSNVTVSTDVNNNTGVNTTVATDTNTNTQTTVSTNVNTDTTTTTVVNIDTGEEQVTVTDGTGTTRVVTPDVVTSGGDVVTGGDGTSTSSTAGPGSTTRSPRRQPTGGRRAQSVLVGAAAAPTGRYTPTSPEETWTGGMFRDNVPTAPDLAALAALFGFTPAAQESSAISALQRASGITPTQRAPEPDYFSYGRESSPSEVMGQYRAGGTVQNYASGGKIMASPLMAAAGGDVSHKGSHYVEGAGGGQDDLIPAKLADGEYVFDAEIVAALGDGSNKEGAKKLDAMREAIRRHKRGGSVKTIPPKAKSPLQYLKEATR